MARKKQLIIPVFVPFGGCPNKCVFCNQNAIAGEEHIPSAKEVSSIIEKYLSTWKGGGVKEAAFYGGSFTGLSREKQEALLGAAHEFIDKGLLDSIRVSTRPDYIDADTVDFLKGYGVRTIELGVQSMSEEVLVRSGRGHGASHVEEAARIIKKAGVVLGLQLMPGLPGDTEESALYSAKEAAALRPDFVRIYPTLVIRGTALEEMYDSGEYEPWGLERMSALCLKMMSIFEEAGVKVIRVGLQPTEELEKGLVAGPYHPAMRDIVLRTV